MQRAILIAVTIGAILLVGAYILAAKSSVPAGIHGETAVTSTAIAAGKRQISLYFVAASATAGQCPGLVPVAREVSDLGSIPKAALDLLLAGPTEAERAKGIRTFIEPGVRVTSMVMDAGDLAVDFDRPLEHGGGACGPEVVRAQLASTLRQFPGVYNVLPSVSGRAALVEP